MEAVIYDCQHCSIIAHKGAPGSDSIEDTGPAQSKRFIPQGVTHSLHKSVEATQTNRSQICVAGSVAESSPYRWSGVFFFKEILQFVAVFLT